MKALVGLVLGLALVGCGEDGGAGSGNDTLPKRGEMAADPTIVAATASCNGEIVLPGQPPGTPNLSVRVTASDPAGQDNLGNCIGETGASSDQGSFGSGSAGSCFLDFTVACKVGTSYVVDLTVSNAMGGVTTASVSLLAD
jgi:hypothetical protein